MARGLRGVFKIEVRVRDVVEAPAGLALQAAAQESQEPRRRRGGQRLPIRLASEHGSKDVGHAFALEETRAAQHLVEHDAERPDVGALVDRLAPRLLRCHVGGGAEDHAHTVVMAGVVIVGDIDMFGDEGAGSIAFASPKSSTFTVPSSRTLMFAGFRSRWMIRCSCAASSASAICFAIGSASSMGMALARCAATILALDELHHEGGHAPAFFEAIDRRDVWMIE